MAELIFLNKPESDEIKINNDFLKTVSESLDLDEEKTKEASELYERNAKKILNSLKENDSILVNGEVQSGKTNNLIVTAASLNTHKKYDLIIYFTGRLNMINDQNHERFFGIFDKFRDQYFTTKIVNPRKIDEQTIQIIRQGKTLLINMLKDPVKVDGLIEILSTYDLSFILINDEGDDSSLSKKGLELFESILSLKNEKKVITITASPYENLLHEYLYQDYIILESSPYYTGIEKFKYNVLKVPKNKQIEFVLKEWINDNIENANTQLLINTTVETDAHLEIKNEVDKHLRLIANFDDSVTDEAKEFAHEVLLNDNVEVTNSNFELTDRRGRKVIIGGHNLSRGVTFKDLTHQILISPRETIKAATLLQRARWCGYRDISNIKIYINDELNVAFKELIRLQKWTKNYDFGSYEYAEKFKSKGYERITLKG